ncbi:MAG: hypothetical protein V4662_26805 [Verrucomicrobiota bacterium]
MQFEATFARRRQLAKQEAFLSIFAESGNILTSAKQAGVSRQLVYYWREISPAFERQLNAAADVAFKSPAAVLPSKESNLRRQMQTARRARP